MLRQMARRPGSTDPTVVVLTPGVYNSAYYEHSFLAQQMGVAVGGGPRPGRRMTIACSCGPPSGLQTGRRHLSTDRRYAFLDPEVFRADDSVLGVAGLMRAVTAKETLTLANAPGTGIADDKVIYAYVPNMIHYYLDPKNRSWRTYRLYVCLREDPTAEYVLDQSWTELVDQGGERIGRLRNPDRASRDRGRNAAKNSLNQIRAQSAQLHCPAHASSSRASPR